MALRIISAEGRPAQLQGRKIRIYGRSGIGKTSLIRTLKGSTTHFINLEPDAVDTEIDSALEREAR